MTQSTAAEDRGEFWDVHKHRNELRVSDNATVYHEERGQLCWWELHWNCIIYFPIRFKDRHAANVWIERGTIAELQEGMSNLHVGFSTRTFKRRP